MASPIGLPVWVKLKGPQNITIHGTVQDLVANSHLTLRDVSSPTSATRLPQLMIQTSQIEDLAVVEASNAPHPTPEPPVAASPGPTPPTGPGQTRHVSAPAQPTTTTSTHRPHAPALVDPAIVSFGNASPVRSASRPVAAETPVKAMLARAAQNLPSPSSPFIAEASKANTTSKLAATKQTPSKQPPQPSVSDAPEVSQDGGPQGEASSRKKTRRGQKKKQPTGHIETADPPPIMNAEVSRNGNDMNGSVKRGKGWRSDPLLQPSPQSLSPSGKANTKRTRRKQEYQEFAQGDTTDIPDGDFDFENELKKFDKTKVFEEIRQGDTTADEDLLVSHNRVAPRPGTYGGKNLHPTEPVLSPKIGPTHLSNELDSSSDADTELNLANGRSSSRHSISRAAASKKQPSRSNSGQMEAKVHPLATSILSDRNANRSSSSLAGKLKAGQTLRTSSPRPDRVISPAQSMSKLADKLQATGLTTSHFVIDRSSQACPVLLPEALDSLEAHTAARFGLSHETFTEAAALRIAEAANGLVDSHNGFRRPSRTNTLRSSVTASTTISNSTETPVIVVLAGNHLLGARALAAARHLVGAGKKVIVAEASSDSADALDPHFKTHSTVIRRMARGNPKLKRGNWNKAQSHIIQLSGPPAVIVDALLPGSMYESLPSVSLQKDAREMIDWANRSRAAVLSIGCPSGVSGIDGGATYVDGEPLTVRPDMILALGAPMQGLLSAVEAGEKWKIGLVDIGINIALKREDAVAFGDRWVVNLTFAEEQAVEDGGK